MTLQTTLLIGAGLLIGAAPFMQAVAQSSVNTGDDMFVEARQRQALGRLVIAPDGSFFTYEWTRPYNWSPDGKRLSRKATERPQAFLFKVPTPGDWDFTNEPTSILLPYPKPGATYWLGNLSPDAKWTGFYELDRDDKALRAGIVEITDKVPPAIVWFDIPPDDARLDRAATWSADGKSIVYPVKGGLARADASSGKATRCSGCSEPSVLRTDGISADVAKVNRGDVPKEAKLIGASPDGSLGVFALDTPDTLNLYFTKDGKTLTLFENERN